MAVSFDDKSATVRYVPGKVTLDQIVKRYDATPFGVVPAGPVVTIANTEMGTIRGWTERVIPAAEATESDTPQPIQLFLEFGAEGPAEGRAEPQPSLADSPPAGLAVLEEFQKVETAERAPEGGPGPARFVAKLYETVLLAAGEITVAVDVAFKSAEEGEGRAIPAQKLEVVLRTTRAAARGADPNTSGLALIGGTLDLRLGHLCEQTGCVQHFHRSLGEIRGLGAVNPHPSLEHPGATVYLRAEQPVDVWGLREELRAQSIEVTGIVPRELGDYRLRIELARWRVRNERSCEATCAASDDTDERHAAAQHDTPTDEMQQCLACRERVVALVNDLDGATDITVAAGGINFRANHRGVDLVEWLDHIERSGAAPSAVWLVPAGVPMPKAAPPLDVQSDAVPNVVGSQAHPIVEFDLTHTCEVGTGVASLLHQQEWASGTEVDAGDDVTVARAYIADRRFANLTPLLAGLRSAGHAPREIRLREFGDLRVQLEFAHLCGDVVYSKPPKPKQKKEDEGEDEKSNDEEKTDDEEKEDEKPKKPFVPQPIAMAETSNGRKAIQAAIESVSWVKNGAFYDYHTRFEFRGGPRKVSFALQAGGDDIVRLDELIDALRDAGCPPKSVVVSRRFPGIPFGKPLPDELALEDREGEHRTLASFKKAGRPLAVAFVSLKTKSRSYGEYEADPKLFQRLAGTIEAHKDRVDVVAVSANEQDEFADVAEFWDKTGLAVPLLHDADGRARAVFNAQITPPPHVFVFDAEGRLRYGGDPHNHWEKPDEEHDDYLAQALERVLAGQYLDNGAVFYNKSLCNCSHPACKCPKCGCGSTCRCGIGHCNVGF